jgi:disulfide bond formation protein DsbB
MPPKGGRPDFGDQNIADVVTFLRGMSDPRRAPAGPLPEVEVVIGDATSAEAVATAAPGAPVAAAPPPTAAPMAAPVSAAQAVTFDPQAAARGKKAYISCMACHGKDATGVKNMGKSLVNTPFVAKLDDAALVDFIKKGRGPTDPENTTKIAMPPKGGNPALKDEQIRDIVAYIRSLNGATPGTVASAAASATPAPATPAVTSATFAKIAAPIAPAEAKAPAGPPVTVTSAAPAPPASVTASAASRSHSTAVAAGDPVARGKKAYISCIACHGKDATGVKNMGKDLVNSPLVARLDDQALTDFIKKGRGPTDPENTTKIAMPPKGGNPALKDEQIKDIVAYLRSLRQSARTE